MVRLRTKKAKIMPELSFELSRGRISSGLSNPLKFTTFITKEMFLFLTSFDDKEHREKIEERRRLHSIHSARRIQAVFEFH